MIADILLRLERVRQTGPDRWIARCPAHEDRNPSFGIKVEADGRILFNCRAGCSAEEVVNAVGLGWDPFFPPKQDRDFIPPVRRPFPAADVLEALADEAMVVSVAAANVAHGVELSPEDMQRVWEANCRIQQAREVALGKR